MSAAAFLLQQICLFLDRVHRSSEGVLACIWMYEYVDRYEQVDVLLLKQESGMRRLDMYGIVLTGERFYADLL